MIDHAICHITHVDNLAHLVREGFLVADGKSRGTAYHLPGESLPTPYMTVTVSSAYLASFSKNLERSVGSSGGLALSSGGLGASSGGLTTNSGGLVRTSGPFGREVQELDKPIVDSLETLTHISTVTKDS